ncbi:hypothetical protein D3C71_2119530 [compost metagenome]
MSGRISSAALLGFLKTAPGGRGWSIGVSDVMFGLEVMITSSTTKYLYSYSTSTSSCTISAGPPSMKE